MGSQFAPPELQSHTYSSSGYDGQFTYFLARDGLTNPSEFDVPAYRAQRILLPAIARTISLGQQHLLVWALLFVNLCGLGVGTYWLERLLERRGASPWIALGFALSVGMFGAVRMTTNEPLAYGLVLGGLYCFDRDRWVLSALLFALAALGKETTLFFPAACGLCFLLRRRFPASLAFGAIALTPFLVWETILYRHFGTIAARSGGADAAGFEIIPFYGLVRAMKAAMATQMLSAAIVVVVFMTVFVLVPAAWSFRELLRNVRASIRETTLEWWVLLANVAIVPFTPTATFAEPLAMMRFIPGLQIGVILFAAASRPRRSLVMTTLWAFASIIVVVVDLQLLRR